MGGTASPTFLFHLKRPLTFFSGGGDAKDARGHKHAIKEKNKPLTEKK